MAEDQKWISVAEAAQELKISERTVRRRCESGKLKGRIETTETGKAWRICLNPIEEDATAADNISTADTLAPLASVIIEHENDAQSEAAAIVAVTAPSTVIAADNREVLAEVGELRQEVGQIKAFIAGQMSTQMDKRLAALPTRENLREDVAELMGAALSPVMQRLEELAKENAQLETQLHQEKQKNLAQVHRPWWKRLFS